MLGWTILRMMLLLWMTRATLQGGTGYSLGPNSGSANFKGNGQSASLAADNGNGAAFKGQSVSLPATHGNGAMFKGYGASAAAAAATTQNGYGAKPNGRSASLPTPNENGATVKGQNVFPAAANGNGAFKGYGASAAATQNEYGAKATSAYGNTQSQPGYGGLPSYGYGTKAGPHNGQAAKPQGYGAKAGPYNGQAAKPQGSSLGNMGYPNNGGKGPKPGYGAKAGPYNGQAAKPQGSFLGNLGYPNSGINGPEPGYGAKAGSHNGQAAKPQGYGAKAGPHNGQAAKSQGSSLGNMGYPISGINGPNPGYGAKAGPYNGQPAKSQGNLGYPNSRNNEPKPGYGAKARPHNGQAAKPQGSFLGNLGYPNSGINGPKPGYGAKAGPYNGQAAKPQGYGVPGGLSKGPYSKGINSGYAPANNGKGGDSGGKGPKGETLSPNEQGSLPVSANTKGVLPQAEHESRTRLPSIMQQTKGPRPLLPQGKASKPLAPQPVVPHGLPSNTFMQGATSYKPSKAYKPVAPAVPQSNVAEAFSPSESARFPQGKAPKPFPQVPQTVALTQEQITRPLISQHIIPQSDISSTTSLVQGPQSKASKPQTQHSAAFQPNQALTQPRNPSTNTELFGLGQTDGQQQAAKHAKPDCGPDGRPNGQWMKLPSPGSMYPKQNGAEPSQPAFGAGVSDYSVPGMNNGYKAFGGGHGSFPGAELSNGYAGFQGGIPKGLGFKGKSQTKYGIGGRAFASSPNGYQSNPFEQYGNDGQQYGTKPYNVKPGFGGLPYNKQPLGYGGEKSPGNYGFGGLQYGGQALGPGTDANFGKYGNPAVSYELFGPVTDGQSVDETRNLEALPHGPVIDGQQSIDHFGEGEVPPQPDDPVILAAGDPRTKFSDTYGTDDFTNERIQPEVVSFPAAPTETPVHHIPAVTSFDSIEGSPIALVSGPVDSVLPDIVSEVSASPLSELPTLMLQPAPPQQIHIQQHLKFHLHPHGNSETGGKENKYNLKGFFGNKYQG